MLINKHRLNSYKNIAKDSMELRNIRRNANVEIRKLKKDTCLMKRRNIDSNDKDNAGISLNEILANMNSSDVTMMITVARDVRKMLSLDINPPIDVVIKNGIVPKLIEFLQIDNIELQFEAAWSITNVASGTSQQTQYLTSLGVIPILVKLLHSTSTSVIEQTVWALGNIAGDSAEFRNVVIQNGVIPIFIELLRTKSSDSLCKNLTWALSNMCRNKNPGPPFEVFVQLAPVFAQLLHSPVKEVAVDSCWALSYISDGDEAQVQLVINTNVLPKLMRLLNLTELRSLPPILRTIGNILTGNEAQTQHVIDAGALNHFHKLLSHGNADLVKEACWALSNIAAGSRSQIQELFNHDLVVKIIEVLSQGEYKCKREAAWCIANLTSGGEVGQTLKVVHLGALQPLCDLLCVNDLTTMKIVLDTIRNILVAARHVDQIEPVTDMIEECGGLDSLEKLQLCESHQIYQMAFSIIETFFKSDESTN